MRGESCSFGKLHLFSSTRSSFRRKAVDNVEEKSFKGYVKTSLKNR